MGLQGALLAYYVQTTNVLPKVLSHSQMGGLNLLCPYARKPLLLLIILNLMITIGICPESMLIKNNEQNYTIPIQSLILVLEMNTF